MVQYFRKLLPTKHHLASSEPSCSVPNCITGRLQGAQNKLPGGICGCSGSKPRSEGIQTGVLIDPCRIPKPRLPGVPSARSGDPSQIFTRTYARASRALGSLVAGSRKLQTEFERRKKSFNLLLFQPSCAGMPSYECDFFINSFTWDSCAGMPDQ